MKIKRRLARIERRAPQPDPYADWLSDEQDVEVFAWWGEQGVREAEPDFDEALAAYREAIEQAKARRDPPFDPPDDFLPEQRESPKLRLLNWRDHVRFPELHACGDWLSEMVRRFCDGVPAVSLAEFAELAAWLEAKRKATNPKQSRG